MEELLIPSGLGTFWDSSRNWIRGWKNQGVNGLGGLGCDPELCDVGPDRRMDLSEIEVWMTLAFLSVGVLRMPRGLP